MKNSSMPIIFMVVSSLVFLINSCGGGGSSSSGSSNAGKTELEGTWSHWCLVDEEADAATRSNVLFWQFLYLHYHRLYAYRLQLNGPHWSEQGEFSIGESFTVSEGVVAKKIDYSAGTQEVTIVNPQTAAISTLGEICGATWEVNKAVDVTNCEDLGPNTGI